ncbi:MAG: TraB/GumN family protein [Bacteroidota bacterium]
MNIRSINKGFFSVGLICVMLSSLGVQAQDHSPSNSLLWEISGNGLKRPSYLFGTIHLIPKEDFFFTDAMRERMGEADRLVLEVELDQSAIFGSMGSMMMTPPNSLKKLLTEEEYEEVKAFVQDSLPTPMPMMMFEMMKPIFSAQQITSLMCGVDLEPGNKGSSSYEFFLSDKFKDSDRPISGLETVQEQLSYLDKVPLKDQAAQLVEAVRDPRKNCGMFEDMVAVYTSQDLDALYQMTATDPGIGSYLDYLLNERNKNWIPRIQEMIKDEALFIAVGAGHLPGEEGVINLLRKAGYTLKPVY